VSSGANGGRRNGQGHGVLEARRLTKKFRAGGGGIEGIDLRVATGEIVGLLGPNGAGKTTCFNIVVGLLAQDSGSILLDGREIGHLSIERRARLGLGYLPQEASVFRKLSAGDNIAAILELRRDLDRDQQRELLEELMQRFQISHLRRQMGERLSGGERRRLEIARALAANPRFLLLDEPFAGIDPISVHGLQQIAQQLRDSGLGILITDHNAREVLQICCRSYIVSGGRVAAQGSPQEILTDDKALRLYLGRRAHI